MIERARRDIEMLLHPGIGKAHCQALVHTLPYRTFPQLRTDEKLTQFIAGALRPSGTQDAGIHGLQKVRVDVALPLLD